MFSQTCRGYIGTGTRARPERATRRPITVLLLAPAPPISGQFPLSCCPLCYCKVIAARRAGNAMSTQFRRSHLGFGFPMVDREKLVFLCHFSANPPRRSNTDVLSKWIRPTTANATWCEEVPCGAVEAHPLPRRCTACRKLVTTGARWNHHNEQHPSHFYVETAVPHRKVMRLYLAPNYIPGKASLKSAAHVSLLDLEYKASVSRGVDKGGRWSNFQCARSKETPHRGVAALGLLIGLAPQ